MGKLNKLFVTGALGIFLGFSSYGQAVNGGPGPLFEKMQAAGILPPNDVPSFNQIIVDEYNQIPGGPVGAPIFNPLTNLDFFFPGFAPFGFQQGINATGSIVVATNSVPGLELPLSGDVFEEGFSVSTVDLNENLRSISLSPFDAVPVSDAPAVIRPAVPVVPVPDEASTLFLTALGVSGLCLFGFASRQRNIRAEKA